MAEAKTEQEPSIEEILESIRQIISEDGTAPTAAAPAELKQPEAPPLEKSNLNLAAEPIAQTMPPAVDLSAKAETKPSSSTDNVIELMDKITPEISMDKQPDLSSASSEGNVLLSDAAANASAAAMAKLLSTNVLVERPTPDRVGSVTLEDMAMELMRPLIKTWLDQNLPHVVEKMVQKEIEKLSRRAMDK